MKALLLVVSVLMLFPIAAPMWAATEAGSDSEEAKASYGRGFALFQRYCRSCHGQSAEGDGHVAKFLKVQPSNLTVLAAENEGEFPTERVIKSIDGRQEMLPLHGRDMPIWGSVFQVDEGQSEADVQKKLQDLVAYLQGIQSEASAEAGADD